MNNELKIKTFTDLIVWQRGHELVLKIYKATRVFPSEEKFGLIDQLRRASVSITSNVAEGFSRANTKEKAQFYRISAGSITEVQNQLMIARDLGYINEKSFNGLLELTTTTQKLLNGLIKKTLLNS